MYLPDGASLSAHAKAENPLIVSDYTGDYSIKNVFIRISKADPVYAAKPL